MSGPETLTFGCRLNACESEVIRARAREAGLDEVVIVNTCAVTTEAVRQARQAIRRARRERPGRPIVVTGCAAQIAPDRFAAMAEVDLVLGNHEKLDPAPYRDFAAGHAARVQVADIFAVRETAAHLVDGFEGRARAFVQVQNGCDHRCTFCVIPYGRGASRSVPAADVVDQVRRLTDAGFNEVVLTGVDLTAWGGDLPDAPVLGDLVDAVLRGVPDLPRLRLSSLDAVEIDPRLFRLIGEQPRLMPHLHLSLQAGDDLILKRMKRRHNRADAVRLCADLRAARPDIAFGADLIAGFPTETEAAFRNSLDLIADCGLAHLHVFPYSARPGTPAARMPAVDPVIVRERAALLRAAGAEALAAHLARQHGRVVRVLAERDGDGGGVLGRAEDYSAVRLEADAPAPSGAIVTARIVGSDGHRLVGRAEPGQAVAA